MRVCVCVCVCACRLAWARTAPRPLHPTRSTLHTQKWTSKRAIAVNTESLSKNLDLFCLSVCVVHGGMVVMPPLSSISSLPCDVLSLAKIVRHGKGVCFFVIIIIFFFLFNNVRSAVLFICLYICYDLIIILYISLLLLCYHCVSRVLA
jgi:hypothetical protein